MNAHHPNPRLFTRHSVNVCPLSTLYLCTPQCIYSDYFSRLKCSRPQKTGVWKESFGGNYLHYFSLTTILSGKISDVRALWSPASPRNTSCQRLWWQGVSLPGNLVSETEAKWNWQHRSNVTVRKRCSSKKTLPQRFTYHGKQPLTAKPTGALIGSLFGCFAYGFFN